MPIVGGQASTTFTTLSMAVIQDRRLDAVARMVLIYCLSQPPDYNPSAEKLAEAGLGGRKQMLRCLRDLERTGYLERSKSWDDAGQVRTVSTVHHFR
jgi:hypothetical protein